MLKAEVLFQYVWAKILHLLNEYSIYLMKVLDVKNLKKTCCWRYSAGLVLPFKI